MKGDILVEPLEENLFEGNVVLGYWKARPFQLFFDSVVKVSGTFIVLLFVSEQLRSG
jgi:hypothetical protein